MIVEIPRMSGIVASMPCIKKDLVNGVKERVDAL